MVKKHLNILIIIATILFVLAKTLISSNIQSFILTKVFEILSCGLLARLFFDFIHQRVHNGTLRIIFVFLFGVITYVVPTYVKIFTWCCKTSKLSITTQLPVCNYIFLNQIFGTNILRTVFWIVFYLLIYILGDVGNRVKSRRLLNNRKTELFSMKNDDNLTLESKSSVVDALINREETSDDTKVNSNYEYFVDNIMNKQQSSNTKFAVRLRNGENNFFHPKVFNEYSKIDIEAIKKEMSLSGEDSGEIFEIGRFENEKLVARLCVDMRGQPVHWEVVQSEA